MKILLFIYLWFLCHWMLRLNSFLIQNFILFKFLKLISCLIKSLFKILNFWIELIYLILRKLLDDLISHTPTFRLSSTTHDSTELYNISLQSNNSVLFPIIWIITNLGCYFNVTCHQSVLQSKVERIHVNFIFRNNQIEKSLRVLRGLKLLDPFSLLILHFINRYKCSSSYIVFP